MSTEEPTSPVLRIVRGNPTPEEVAAVLGVALAMSAGEPAPEPTASPWTAATRLGRQAPRPSPAAWRLSLRTT